MTLPDERRDAGLALLKLTDSVGFDAVGAGWGFTAASAAWRFYLFTEMADTKGPLWVWERLLKAFGKLNLPQGITPLDIVVASPEEWLYRSMMIKLQQRKEMAVVHTIDVIAEGYGIDRLWLLRSKPERSLLKEAARRSSARKFDLKVRQLLAA